jgi:hypothetical protein
MALSRVKQGEVLGTRLCDQHSIARIAMQLRQSDERFAMIGQHREQIEAAGNRQETLVPSNAVQGHQDCDFPEAGGAEIT